MDVAAYLRRFESSLSSYTGDDPLDPWDRFVQFLEQKLPAGDSSMSLVFDTLVQRFQNVDRFANDVRYINYCIRCASFYSDPIALYSEIFSKGIGTRTAVLYVAWARQFEQKGMNQRAEAVYQKALENRAQPADTVLHEYRQFQSRTRTQLPVLGARTPLQNSQLTNQESADTASQNQVPDCPSRPPANRTVVVVSRSETSGSLGSSQSSGIQTVPEYTKDDLVCDGSELCFEEIRAGKYFHKLRVRQEKEQREAMERNLKEQEESVQRMKYLLEQINQGLEACGGLSSQTSSQQQPSASQTNSNPPQPLFTCPPPSNHLSSRRSLGLRFHTDPTFIQEATTVPALPQQSSEVSQHASVLPDRREDPESVSQTSMVRRPVSSDLMNFSVIRPADVLQPGAQVQLSSSYTPGPAEHSVTHLDGGTIPECEEKLDASHGGAANVSHVTPNNSLGFVQATPSRVLPSPTVNTREALGVIMDMFQAPTFLEEPFSNTSALHTAEKDFGFGTSGAASYSPQPPSTPFTIYQDEDKENCSAAGPSQKPKPVRALTDIGLPKVDKPNETAPDLVPDESTMWGARYNSLNSLAACPNSTTDFAMLAQFVSTPFTHKTPFNGNFYQDQETNCDGDDADENAFIRRQTKKLSPIMEQSPGEDKAVSQLLPSSVRQGTIVGEALTTTSITMVQPPAVLSFRDQTDFSRSAGPGWEVYTSPEQPPKPASLVSVRPKTEPFVILRDVDQPTSPEQAQDLVCDVPMSPECLKPNWLNVRSPEVSADQDLDAFLSPCRPKKADMSSMKTLDVPMSPDQLQLCANVPMSPQQVDPVDEPMMSPDRDLRPRTRLLSDPWDNNLISELLRRLSPPLTSHPHCFTWQRDVPPISPKTTISMGKASLRIDGVLGEGAFATVYQATDPMTSEKMVLKVQKPANPWEFYIDTRLDSRLQPDRRHLFSSVRSAHLFHNGSVLLGELHNYGTLLNAVNIYRTLSDKVMPQPLVLYFTVCILHMVETLHAAHIVHADIKPDNFMLGERFLENECFDPQSFAHGLVLIDLGQSIDMELFPEGTAFTAKCLTSGFQCTEMLSGKPWNYQTDYFGVAGTVHCMLFGSYMKVTNTDGVWSTNGVFRRNPHSDLWLEFFTTLLNVPDCESLPSLQKLRCQMSSVLQQHYSNKLPSLKRRLVVQLLEAHKAARR